VIAILLLFSGSSYWWPRFVRTCLLRRRFQWPWWDYWTASEWDWKCTIRRFVKINT